MITEFTSKRYIRFNQLIEWRLKQMHSFPLYKEQEKELNQTFQQKQSVRYLLSVKEEWIEETFEGIDGKQFTLYTDIKDDELENFIQKVLTYFHYVYGDKIPGEKREKETVRKMFHDIIGRELPFSVVQDTLIYENEKGQVYLLFTPLENNEFLLRVSETEHSNGMEEDKEEIEKIRKIIKEKMKEKQMEFITY